MSRLLTLAAVAAAATAGCGLIDSDITQFDLSMPERTFTVDTEQWELSSDASLPSIDCSGMPGVCSTGIDQYCGSEACFGSCGATDECQIKVLVSLYRTVNLYDEKPELQTLDDQPLVDVTIDRIYYVATENTMNVSSPELTVYLAPQTIMNPGDPQARAIGVIAPLPAQTLVLDPIDVDLTPEGRDILRQFMTDYRTPFNIIVGAEVDIQAGDTMPEGRVVAKVSVDAHAGL
jgi:hypothetical protein